jgi:hypothetical protein
VAGNRAITFSDTSTVDQIANTIVSQVQLSNLGLTASNLGDGFIELAGSTFQHLISVGTSGLTQIGFPGVEATVAVNYEPFESFDKEKMAIAIADAINGSSSLEGVNAIPKTDSVVVSGADSVSGILISLVSGIEDRAGNPLYPNRQGRGTTFEINLTVGLDWGDAPSLSLVKPGKGDYPTTEAQNGARHLVVDGFRLGDQIDTEADGQPDLDYVGDDENGLDDEDGLVNYGTGLPNDIKGIRLEPNGIYLLQVQVNGIGPDRPGVIDAWIDFNDDQSWDGFTLIDPPPGEDPNVSEKLEFFSTVDSTDPITGEPTEISGEITLANGINDLYFRVPPYGIKTCPALRIRLSSEGDLPPTGLASDGEVEDYELFTNHSDWHNTAIAQDVNKDGFVSPIDALLVINYMEVNVGPGKLLPNGLLLPRSAAETGNPPLVDVNDDGYVVPLDALRVVNFINDANVEGEAEGEGKDALMRNYGITQVTVSSASIADLVEPVTSSVVDIPVMLSPERVREAQFAELDLARETSLETVLAEIGGEVSDLRDNEDGHDEFFATVQY